MISYTTNVYNEVSEINRLLVSINRLKTNQDEIVVVQTYRDRSETLESWFLEIEQICTKYATVYNTFHFKNKFSDLKNYTNNLATKLYIINLDADELISENTLDLWKQAIAGSPADIYYVPRINTVQDYALEDIKQYNWSINNQGWINWPDYQPRIFKNNQNIRWVGDVHEKLEGTDKIVGLPADPRLAIVHHKHIIKQRQQNTFYDTILKTA